MMKVVGLLLCVAVSIAGHQTEDHEDWVRELQHQVLTLTSRLDGVEEEQRMKDEQLAVQSDHLVVQAAHIEQLRDVVEEQQGEIRQLRTESKAVYICQVGSQRSIF